MTELEKKRWSSVTLPSGTSGPYEVYVNSVTQKEGEDFEIEGDVIYFFRPIRKEAKLGFFRWLVLFIGIAGSYKQNDSVDVGCVIEGHRDHLVNLPIEVLIEPTEEERGMLVGSYSPGG
ncbi:MAG: hypothetical protein QM648_00540 [Solirubrobacterales bacterium]